jgi:hypothetical protein
MKGGVDCPKVMLVEPPNISNMGKLASPWTPSSTEDLNYILTWKYHPVTSDQITRGALSPWRTVVQALCSWSMH